MTGMHALWLPIVLSAVIGFVVSSLIHMVTPWHHGDYGKVPNQLGVMDALRPFNIPPGDYMLPRPDGMADMKSAEFKELVTRGPKVVMTVMQPGWGAMGGMLGAWFVYLLLVFACSSVSSPVARSPLGPSICACSSLSPSRRFLGSRLRCGR